MPRDLAWYGAKLWQPVWRDAHPPVTETPCALSKIMNMDDVKNRIREHAFLLWQEAGCPVGRAEEFWVLAEQAELGLRQPAELETADDPARFAGF